MENSFMLYCFLFDLKVPYCKYRIAVYHLIMGKFRSGFDKLYVL